MTISVPLPAAPADEIQPDFPAKGRLGKDRLRSWARLLVGPAILGALCWRLGTGPFLDGIRQVDGWSVAAAAGFGLLTTGCSAWRWRLVAAGLGIRVGLLPAVAAYYRSQFLNTTLPGGVLGDVHRGIDNGRSAGDVGRGLRAVGWERVAGQLVQIVIAAVLLLTLPSPLARWIPGVIAALAVAGIGIGLLGTTVPFSARSRVARIIHTAVGDLRAGLFTRRAWPGIVVASTVVVAGHIATFLVAARAAGTVAPLGQLLPLAVLVLLAASLPTNIGGWGPREGVAAWAFAAAGLGADQGVKAAVVFGMVTAIATLPGAAALLAGRLHPATSARRHAANGLECAVVEKITVDG